MTRSHALPGCVRQLIAPWIICLVVVVGLLIQGAWPQTIAVVIVAATGTAFTYLRQRIPTVSISKSLEYGVRQLPSSVVVDEAKPLIAVSKQVESIRYVWLIPEVARDEWAYVWAQSDGRRRPRDTEIVVAVSTKKMDTLADAWNLRVIPQGSYSDELWRIHFGGRRSLRSARFVLD